MQGELLKIWQSEQRTCVFVTHSIVEAAFLADRIVLMTARPGRVKRELTVSIPRPRDRTSEDFIALYRDVDSVLREEIEKASAANEGRAPRE